MRTWRSGIGIDSRYKIQSRESYYQRKSLLDAYRYIPWTTSVLNRFVIKQANQVIKAWGGNWHPSMVRRLFKKSIMGNKFYNVEDLPKIYKYKTLMSVPSHERDEADSAEDL